MNNLKRLLFAVILLSFTCSIDFFSCDEAKNDDYTKAGINTPTNDYQVAVQIYSLGGMVGCTAASIEQSGEAITDAEIIINNATVVCDTSSEFSPMYVDTSSEISYLEHTEYEMEVRHNGETIATGKSIMPSTPVITSPTSPYSHQLNKSLTVKWETVQDATAIEFNICNDFDEDEHEIDTLLSPLKTSFTVPASFFDTEGEYYIEIVAYNGINYDTDYSKYVDNEGNITKSINMKGAAGEFIVMNFYPISDDGFIVNIGSLKKPTQFTKSKKSYKEIRQERLQQRMDRFGF
ncbi:MAG: hypothetical protein PHW79_09760 [Candidatus Marinimicrobia bacterium]|nr:hypothetical protein [Candidatus Neomarinimicrobiota bacterium]